MIEQSVVYTATINLFYFAIHNILKLLDISYYRIYVDKGYYIVVLEYHDDSKWAKVHYNGVGFKYYIFKEGTAFNLDEYSVTNLLRLLREEKLLCPRRIWDKINSSVKNKEQLTSPKGGESKE